MPQGWSSDWSIDYQLAIIGAMIDALSDRSSDLVASCFPTLTPRQTGRNPCEGGGHFFMQAEAESDRLVGVVLGGAYQLVGRIGEGGMGAVYEAHHLRLRKRVAVKLINRALARHPEALARFHREASVASCLGHPNLVNVIDFGTSEAGEPYLVMEYLEGEDLERRILRAGCVPLKSAVQIARQVASALAVAHTKGIVHRDLKPANIFLIQLPGEPDFVKVLDFGVSKIKAASTKLTDASMVIGTPQYMSPEQASWMGCDIDHRADQWALACIVWEMLSGRPPFSADNIDAVFYQLLHLSPPLLSKYAPDLPPAVEPVLLRALSKGAEDRYPSTRDFVRALEAAALGNWSELTPMPFCPANSMALREAAASGDVRMALAMTQVAAMEGGSDASADPTLKTRRGGRLAARLAGLAIALLMAAAGLWFANARSTSAVAKADQQASVARLAVAQVRPATPPVAMEKAVMRKSAVGKQSSLPRSSKARMAPHGAVIDPFDRMLAPSSADLPKKANPFARPSASRVRNPESHDVRPERRGVTRRDGKRHTFEAL